MWRAIYHELRRWAKRSEQKSAGRIEITVQTDRLLIVRRRRSAQVWCEMCGREVDVVGFQEAGALAGNLQMLQAGAGLYGWHLCPAQDGALHICLESLLKSLQQGKDSASEANVPRGGVL